MKKSILSATIATLLIMFSANVSAQDKVKKNLKDNKVATKGVAKSLPKATKIKATDKTKDNAVKTNSTLQPVKTKNDKLKDSAVKKVKAKAKPMDKAEGTKK